MKLMNLERLPLVTLCRDRSLGSFFSISLLVAKLDYASHLFQNQYLNIFFFLVFFQCPNVKPATILDFFYFKWLLHQWTKNPIVPQSFLEVKTPISTTRNIWYHLILLSLPYFCASFQGIYMKSFWSLKKRFHTYSDISIVDLEQVNVGWVQYDEEIKILSKF